MVWHRARSWWLFACIWEHDGGWIYPTCCWPEFLHSPLIRINLWSVITTTFYWMTTMTSVTVPGLVYSPQRTHPDTSCSAGKIREDHNIWRVSQCFSSVVTVIINFGHCRAHGLELLILTATDPTPEPPAQPKSSWITCSWVRIGRISGT